MGPLAFARKWSAFWRGHVLTQAASRCRSPLAASELSATSGAYRAITAGQQVSRSRLPRLSRQVPSCRRGALTYLADGETRDANLMLHDPWLSRWLPLIEKSAGGRPVLEIGCGNGDDTSTLVKAGFPVVAFDISSASVATTQARVPEARVSSQDVRAPFPLGDGEAGTVVASLTLHYFPWAETLELVRRVRRTLVPGGLLLCRLNSTEDKHFGASGHPVIEPNYFLVDDQPKRFFDRPDVEALFRSGWTVLSMEHQTTKKYVRTKALWEVVAQGV